MRFGYLGVINFISNLLGIATAIALALHGFEVWAFVWREIALSQCSLLVHGFSAVDKVSRLNVDVRSSLRFGADLSGVSVVQYFTLNVDRVLIGRFSGATPLGLYTKAFQLAMMPIENIRMIFWDVGLSPLSALRVMLSGIVDFTVDCFQFSRSSTCRLLYFLRFSRKM